MWMIKMEYKLQKHLEKILKNEEGQAFSEYAIVIGVVAVLLIATVVLFKDAIVGVFTRIISSLSSVGA